MSGPKEKGDMVVEISPEETSDKIDPLNRESWAQAGNDMLGPKEEG
jgi:hypothetical protein